MQGLKLNVGSWKIDINNDEFKIIFDFGKKQLIYDISLQKHYRMTIPFHTIQQIDQTASPTCLTISIHLSQAPSFYLYQNNVYVPHSDFTQQASSHLLHIIEAKGNSINAPLKRLINEKKNLVSIKEVTNSPSNEYSSPNNIKKESLDSSNEEDYIYPMDEELVNNMLFIPDTNFLLQEVILVPSNIQYMDYVPSDSVLENNSLLL